MATFDKIWQFFDTTRQHDILTQIITSWTINGLITSHIDQNDLIRLHLDSTSHIYSWGLIRPLGAPAPPRKGSSSTGREFLGKCFKCGEIEHRSYECKKRMVRIFVASEEPDGTRSDCALEQTESLMFRRNDTGST